MSQNIYDSFNNFIFRCPLLPFTANQSLLFKGDLKEMINTDLMDIFYIASTDFFDIIQSDHLQDKANIKTKHTINKYYLRTKFRSTPFGLMAGVGAGKISDGINAVEIKTPESFVRHSRLDMDYLYRLSMDLSRLDFIKPYLHYFPNSTIYQVHDKVRYTEYTVKDTQRIHMLNSVYKSIYIGQILQRARNGARVEELLETMKDTEFEEMEKSHFVDQLIEAQLLVSEFELAVTGEPMDLQLLATLQRIAVRISKHGDKTSVLKIIDQFEKLLSLLQHVDQNGINKNNLLLYAEIENLITQIGSSYKKKYLIQTDLQIQPVQAHLNPNTASNVLKAVDIVSRFTTNRLTTALDSFKSKFYERWGDQEIPLVLALDNEIGIGYPIVTDQKMDFSPVLDELVMPVGATGIETIDIDQKVVDFWNSKYKTVTDDNLNEIILTPEDINGFPSRLTELPCTLSVMVSLLKVDNSLSAGSPDCFLFKAAGGSSASNLIARFCHHDADIADLARAITEKEELFYKDEIVAEVVHLPESRTGNILMRPHMHSYEIPFLSASGVEQAFQIPVADLMISIRNNILKVTSSKLKKFIIPRLTSAHNFHYNSLPVYHFLCDLQTDNVLPWVKLNTGILERNNKSLPRISYQKNIILQPAQWKLVKDDYIGLINANPENLLQLFSEFRQTWHIPEFISLQDGDNELVINTSDIDSVSLFVSEIRNKPSVTIVEFLFDPNAAQLITEGSKSHVNEVVFFYYKNSLEKKTPVAERPIERPFPDGVKRLFHPGDEWVYFKIYTGYKSADELLVSSLMLLADDFLQHKIIHKWFFIRYIDTEFHLRIRFLLTDTKFINQVISGMNKQMKNFTDAGIIWKIQLDTYSREMERYGTENISDSESIFFIESEAVLKLLSNLEGDEGEMLRWFCGFRMMEGYLEVFGLSIEEKVQFVGHIKDLMKPEFEPDKNLKKQLDRKFRKHKDEINKWIISGFPFIPPGLEECAPLIQIISDRDSRIAEIVEKNYFANPENLIKQNLASYIHMNMNRLFRSQNRLHEFVIYCMLEKYYASKLGRIKNAGL